MILIGYGFWDVLIGMLWVSLGLLVVVLGYRRLLRFLQGETMDPKKYCVLYSLDDDPAHGEVPFYFTAEEMKAYALKILDAKMNVVTEVASGETKIGGNIIRYNTRQLANGVYFYSLETENQKTMKKMRVENPA